MERISVIIPVYNTEPYIRRCLQSLFDQTYQNWEALIIDDGSTDKSLDVCRELASGDRRIRVVSQENRGVSAARNRGIDLAQGVYLFFLDSDDAIHPLLLEEMILQAHKTGADFLACGQAKLPPEQVDPAIRAASVHDVRPVWEAPPREETPNLIHTHARFITGAGGKMIRRAALEELRFREDLFVGEDTYLVNLLFYRHVQVAYTLQSWYFYNRRPESAINSLASHTDPRYYMVYRLLEEYDILMNNHRAAGLWEEQLLGRLQKHYLLRRRAGDAAGMAAIRKIAAAEFRRPLFLTIPRNTRWAYRLFFSSYPCYLVVRFLYNHLPRRRR